MDSECVEDIELKTLAYLRGLSFRSEKVDGYMKKLEKCYPSHNSGEQHENH